MCIDHKSLNPITKGDTYPLPLEDDLLQGITEARVFSVIDSKSGFYQILVKEQSREKTAFVTPEGLYEFTVMPFGVKNAPATFQRVLNEVLKDLKGTVKVSRYTSTISSCTRLR